MKPPRAWRRYPTSLKHLLLPPLCLVCFAQSIHEKQNWGWFVRSACGRVRLRVTMCLMRTRPEPAPLLPPLTAWYDLPLGYMNCTDP